MNKISTRPTSLESGIEKLRIRFLTCFETANSTKDMISSSNHTGPEKWISKFLMIGLVNLDIHWRITLTNKSPSNLGGCTIFLSTTDSFMNSDSLNTRFVVSRQRFLHRLERILVRTDSLRGKAEMIKTKRQSGKFDNKSDLFVESIVKMWWFWKHEIERENGV